jgi:hypothetical protein
MRFRKNAFLNILELLRCILSLVRRSGAASKVPYLKLLPTPRNESYTLSRSSLL